MTTSKVLGLNHVAYRCRDAKETAHFYRDVLGMRLAHVIVSDRVPSTQEYAPHCHLFFEMDDHSWVAFFDVADEDHVTQEVSPDWAQHLAMEVESLDVLREKRTGLQASGVEVLGPIDHGFIQSIYFRDPSGHRLELACRTHTPADIEQFAAEAADELLAWDARKSEHLA
jgi:glyoxylase I family protein